MHGDTKPVEEAPSDCVAEAGSSAFIVGRGSPESVPPAFPQPEVSWTVMDSTGYSPARTRNVSQITAHLGQGIAGLFPGMAQGVARKRIAPTTASGSNADATARPSVGGNECRDGGNLSGNGTSDAQDLSLHTVKKRGRPITRNFTDNEKSQNVQEKNRQAQARFRQRQKVRHCFWNVR
jgi:hypothetical protein